MGTVVVLAGGDPEPTPSVPLPGGAYVIAADSGLHLAGRLGLIVDLVVGLRVPEDEEREGLDITSHGESAYHS